MLFAFANWKIVSSPFLQDAANFVYGGGEIGIQNILTRMLLWGMLTYSGVGACGAPPIHMGPVAIGGHLEEMDETFRLYGERMASMTVKVLG